MFQTQRQRAEGIPLSRPVAARNRQGVPGGVHEFDIGVDQTEFGLAGECRRGLPEMTGQPDIVGVEQGQQAPPRRLDCGVARYRWALIGLLDDPNRDPRRGRPLFCDLGTRVGRPVVDDDDFEIRKVLGQRAVQGFGDVVGPVEHRHQHADQRRWHVAIGVRRRRFRCSLRHEYVLESRTVRLVARRVGLCALHHLNSFQKNELIVTKHTKMALMCVSAHILACCPSNFGCPKQRDASRDEFLVTRRGSSGADNGIHWW